MDDLNAHDRVGTAWWNSTVSMARAVRRSAILAVGCFALAALTWPMAWLVAVAALVGGTAAVLATAFAWFRLDDLRGRDVR
jgi:hypothetical protein